MLTVAIDLDAFQGRWDVTSKKESKISFFFSSVSLLRKIVGNLTFGEVFEGQLVGTDQLKSEK